MDALYFLRHSRFDDIEIRYSLRSVERYLPSVRKVWIFGDRPEFLSDDTSVIEHMPHESVARVGHYRTPVTNFLLMFYLSSLIPKLDHDYLWFCDDFILIDHLSEREAKKARYIQDLGKVANRGTGLWKDSLWRTYDLLKRLGYTGWNFETHVPTFFTKTRVLEAWCEFKDYVTEDRWYGMLGPTAILNHAYKVEQMPLTQLSDEARKIGFYGKPPTYEEIVEKCRGKTFLSFDDEAFGDSIRQYLAERFPTPSKYERGGAPLTEPVADQRRPAPLSASSVDEIPAPSAFATWPKVILPNRNEFPKLLNERGLVGEGAEVGTLRGQFAATILQAWQGRRLHGIDPWREASNDPHYVDINNVSQQVHERNFAETKRRLAPFGDRCRIHRLTSQQAAGAFADGSLDFVYLDARHYRAALEEDLRLWGPKVRAGGLLGGHDYLDGILPSGRFEVKSTVDEWAAVRGLQVACSGEHVWRSWFIRMP